MYKETESMALRLMRKCEKTGAPSFMLDYCRFAIDKARHYRNSANDKEACAAIDGWRRNRFTKAIDMASHAADVADAYLRAHRVEK